MARIRTIKPEFWEDEKIARLPYACRLLYIGMWNFADDYGFVKGSHSLLKSQIFPYEDNLRITEVDKWIDALVKARMLVPVICDPQHSGSGESYYVIRTFRSHQIIDKRYRRSFVGEKAAETILEGLHSGHVETTTCSHSGHAETSPQEMEGKGRESNTVTSNEDNSICESIEEDTSGLEINSARTWKNDFGVYKEGLRETYNALRSDSQWLEQQRKYHPGVDILLTLEKACVNYWATEAGWKHKKSQRSAEIDWRRTLTNAISQPQNKVYEPRTAAAASGASERRNSREEMANEAARYLSGLTR